MAPRLIADMKERPRSHWAAYQRGLRKAELSYVSELQHGASRRANHRLELHSINSMFAHLYRPELRPSLEARKAALSAAIKESLGQ